MNQHTGAREIPTIISYLSQRILENKNIEYSLGDDKA